MSLINLNEIKYKVSSVLDQNTKQFGKSFLFDDNEETCWNSDQVWLLKAIYFCFLSVCAKPLFTL